MEHWIADREAPIIYEASLDSSNLYLKTLAERGAAQGTVVIAGQQSAGRGRLGRSFLSPKGGLYLSILFRPTCSLEQASSLSAMAAVAVCRAVKELTGLEPQIKWPNDVVLNGKKLCGILAESAQEGPGRLRIILGIGVNISIRQEEFPPELRETACSLFTETGTAVEKRLLAQALIRELDSLYAAWLADSRAFLEPYRALCVNCGREVLILRRDGDRPARALTVNEDYSLRVAYSDGTEEDIRFGEVSVRGMLGYV